jgi:hypothetical protein
MNESTDQVPETPDVTTPRTVARSRTAFDAVQRRDHRHRGEPPRATVDRRWRFTDAIAAARQLSTGSAAAS